jgi:hypothetical protein
MKGVLMHNRKFGRQTNLTRPIRGHLRYYNEGYRVFEHSMADLSAFEINRCPKTFTSLNEKLPKDDQIENYFRAPNLSFTGFGSNCDRISDVFDLCKTFNIKKLVLRLGEARSTGENHIKIARDSVIAFMNKIGTECESFGVHIYWENSSSGFGSIENIIDILSNEKLEYREFLRLNLILIILWQENTPSKRFASLPLISHSVFMTGITKKSLISPKARRPSYLISMEIILSRN